MLLWTGALFLLVQVEGHGDNNKCPRKDPSPGVLVLSPGSQVLLHCHGDVIVDRVLRVQGNSERPFTGAHQQSTQTTSDEGHRMQTAERSTATYHTETVRLTHHEDMTPEETSVTPTDGYYNKNGLTTSGAYQRETGRTSTEGFRGGTDGTSSVGHDEHTEGTLPGEHKRETGGPLPLVDQEEAVSTRPHMASSTSRVGSTAGSKSPLQNDVTTEGGAVELERRSYWTRNGVPVQGSADMSALTLPQIGRLDVGNYSCYRQGVLMSSVKITLGTPPVKPILSCYRRSPKSNTRCDWTSPQPLDPIPTCRILLEKSRRHSEVKCSYSALRSRCWCVLDHRALGMDESVYAARLCVTNAAGNATSPEVRFTPANSIKPDPPASVRVNGVVGGERMLGVVWSYPASWSRDFYFLRFQLRYRPSQREKYQTVETETQSWTITDALPHTEYEIQLRAIEEFGIGRWSDWSPPVYAHTWTAALELTTTPPDPLWIEFEEGSGSGREIMMEPVSTDDSFDIGTVLGICVLAGLVILLSVYVFRHRMRFASTLGKLGSASASADPPAARPQPPALDEEKPLMSPVSPTPSQDTVQHQFPPVQEESGQNVHFHNMDYFLVPKE
ncbi:interleukin-6 receptor subunit alpha-like [Sardina pilchardus]|uniref:interleukin-6 receptor subunit alpha-like n=1 Tax=Sardina pilchardus TaxID=27697 RepID=UPI002E11C396